MERWVSKTEVLHSCTIPSSRNNFFWIRFSFCGRRSCRKERERKAGGLIDEKGACAKGAECTHFRPATARSTAQFWLRTSNWTISSCPNPKDSPWRWTPIKAWRCQGEIWTNAPSFTWFWQSYLPRHSPQISFPPSSARICLTTQIGLWLLRKLS